MEFGGCPAKSLAMVERMINCRFCNYTCEEFSELAKHIVEKKSTHRHGLKWASSFLLKVNILNQKKDFQGRIPLTIEEKESKESCERELSGRVKTVATICPNCSKTNITPLAVEFVNSGISWHMGRFFAVNCPACRKHN